MRNSNKRHGPGRIVGLFLLALVCIGSVELIVCRFAAPELYEQVTSPAEKLIKDVMEQGSSLFRTISAAAAKAVDDSTSQSPPVSQAVSEPEALDAPPAEDPAVTTFATRQGQEILTGGAVELVYFNQGEEPWASGAYGPDHIQGYGCGPTSLAMLISTLGDETLDPIQAAQAAYKAGYCAPGSGSYLSIVEGMAADYGLEAKSFTDLTAEALCRELVSGHLFIALMGKGHFTNSGHFIVLRGVTLEGKILVADPNSRDRSLVGWDPQLILDELSSSRSDGAPLWCFSTLGNVE